MEKKMNFVPIPDKRKLMLYRAEKVGTEYERLKKAETIPITHFSSLIQGGSIRYDSLDPE